MMKGYIQASLLLLSFTAVAQGCPEGYTLLPTWELGYDVCYREVNELLTLDEAIEQCRADGLGSLFCPYTLELINSDLDMSFGMFRIAGKWEHSKQVWLDALSGQRLEMMADHYVWPYVSSTMDPERQSLVWSSRDDKLMAVPDHLRLPALCQTLDTSSDPV